MLSRDQLRSIALEVANKHFFPGMAPHGGHYVDFALAFLAAVQEKAEPVAQVHINDDGFYRLRGAPNNLKEGIKLYTHPSFEQRNGGQTSERTASQESPAVERCAAHPEVARLVELVKLCIPELAAYDERIADGCDIGDAEAAFAKAARHVIKDILAAASGTSQGEQHG